MRLALRNHFFETPSLIINDRQFTDTLFEVVDQTMKFIISYSYRSRLRNKLVAEAFYLTGNIEKYGSGFIRLRKAMRDYPPELSLSTQEISGGIMLTFAQVGVEQPEMLNSAGQAQLLSQKAKQQ